MCGRFTLRTPQSVLVRQFGLAELAQLELPLRYNIAPTQPVLAVRRAESGAKHGAEREPVWLRWGLVPPSAADPSRGPPLINARGETAATRPAFRAAFRHRRCLIPADGFYEWRQAGRVKRPFFIHRADDGPFAFAGLWERSSGAGQALESCTILTTDANACLRPLHDRMPVILLPANYSRWLDPATSLEEIQGLLRPVADDFLMSYQVGRRVNDPRCDEPGCVQPLAAEPQAGLPFGGEP